MIELVVVWHTAAAKGLDNAVEAHLGEDEDEDEDEYGVWLVRGEGSDGS